MHATFISIDRCEPWHLRDILLTFSKQKTPPGVPVWRTDAVTRSALRLHCQRRRKAVAVSSQMFVRTRRTSSSSATDNSCTVVYRIEGSPQNTAKIGAQNRPHGEATDASAAGDHCHSLGVPRSQPAQARPNYHLGLIFPISIDNLCTKLLL